MESRETQPPSTGVGGHFLRLAFFPALILLPLAISVGPANHPAVRPTQEPGGEQAAPSVVPVPVRTARELAWVLDRVWEKWADPPARIPNVAPLRFPPDIGSLPRSSRKRVFVRSVLPHILAENDRILRQRKALEIALRRARAQGRLTEFQTLLVLRLAKAYRVEITPDDLVRDPVSAVRRLLRRADVVPVSLALAQAAVESAWGTSRFAREGNSLFGQWVFSSGKGMAPRERPAGARYAVAAFPDLAASVRGYMRNLNTLWAYASFRELREALRAQGSPLRGAELAQGLLMYSTRREAYVEDLVRVIRQNRFGRFDPARLVPVPESAVRRLTARVQVLASSEGVPVPDA